MSALRIAVVGGGYGGLASAVRLAKLGHDVTLFEATDRLGGALGSVSTPGESGAEYRWDTGPTHTLLPAVLRDLFRKSGRPLERELDLVPVDPARQHRFEDGAVLDLPSGNRASQLEAVSAALGSRSAEDWGNYTKAHARTWELLRRDWLEQPYDEHVANPEATRLLRTRETLHRSVGKAFRDKRLRALATHAAVAEGHHPRNVPAWAGMRDYVEQNFGTWTVPGGMARVAERLEERLGTRRVEVHTGTAVLDLEVSQGRVRAVRTAQGVLDVDAAVVAVDPRGLPALAGYVARTMPALPPVVVHLGLVGDLPDLPAEVVLHGDPMLVVRTGGQAPPGCHAWTVYGRGKLAEDVVTALARHGLHLREQIDARVDRTPLDQVRTWGSSPYGVLWQGSETLRHRLGTRTPVAGVYCAGAHTTPGAGLPYVGLSAALVAQCIGPA